MDQQNRLLAMLQSATSGSASLPTNQFGQSPSTSSLHSPPAVAPGSSTSTLSAASHLPLPASTHHTGSPREPSPTPPPPSLQAVSLQDLFRNIQSPPVPPAASSASTSVASPPPKEDHHNKLLGMLKTIGQPQPPALPSGVGSASSTPRTGTPEKKHGPITSPPPAPVINHPTAPDSVPPPAMSNSPAERAMVSPEPPRKSMFDFVSPFDVFDKPKATPPAPAAPAQAQKATPPPQQSRGNAKASVQPQSPAKTASPSRSSQRELPAAAPAHEAKQPKENVQYVTSATGEPVQELSESEIAKATEKIWHVNKVSKDVKGNGSASMPSNIVIDLSKPNADSLVNSPASTQVTPAARIRPESLDFKLGRRVAYTANWIAYTFQQGRIRLIDTHTGALGVIQLVMTACLGPVRDIAVTPTFVAALGHDSAVSVWRVPDGWAKDDFQAEMVAHFPTIVGPLGRVFKLEWVKKDGRSFLAIGGEEGVMLVDPTVDGHPNRVTVIGPLAAANRVLKTEGPVVDFCLNQTHQAIGLLSATSQFTLYNLATLARVWNRQLPSDALSTPPSSVQFCESNILVGRANNTHFELVQITTDLAVLSSIKMYSPSPSSEKLHYAQAVYDSNKAVLWVAPFSRGSLYAFKYALKGEQPISNVTKDKVVAFDRVAEYPLDSVLSLALAKKTAEEDAELVYATPSGVNQVTIPKSALDALKAPATSAPKEKPATDAKVPGPASTPIKTEPIEKRQNKNTPTKASSKVASPAVVKTELPSSEDEAPASIGRAGMKSALNQSAGSGQTSTEDAAGAISQEELNKVLKRTEDRLSNQFRQSIKNEIATLNTRLAGLSNSGPDDIASKVEKSIKASLPNIISQEIKRTVIPSVTGTIQNEVRMVTSNQVPAAIFDALQVVPKELERGLTPIVQRTLASVVNNSMERAIQEIIQHTFMPAMTVASSKLCDQLISEMRSEMLQIRKELSPPRNEAQLSNDALLRTMASSISELQKQVLALSEQVSRPQLPPQNQMSNGPSALGPGPGPAPHVQPAHPAPPAPVQANQPAQPPAPTLALPPGLTPAQLEDTFLQALSANQTSAILQLVSDHLGLSEVILPWQNGKSPLSQAVLLTLLHRLAIALNELNPGHPLFAQIVAWERRTSVLVDPKDENIKTYISRVLHVVQDLLNNVLSNLQRLDPSNTVAVGAAGHSAMIRQTIEVVSHKQSLV